MNILKPTRMQWLTAIFPLPLVVLLFLYLLIDFSSMSNSDLLILALLFIPLSFSSWYTCVVINNFITSQLPGQSNTVKRALVLFSVHLVWLIILVLLVFNGLMKASFLHISFIRHNLITAILLGAVFNIIFCIIWQVEYIFQSWKRTLAEKEWIESQLLQQEFDRLKQQLNPHFLFNNLNVLSSLISGDAEKASYFLDKLSQVYRYLLKRGKDDLTTVQEELAFINSYGALMEIRFGNSVKVEIDTAAANNSYLLPTLSLQLLVENAIKHNIASKLSPLVISIKATDENFLEVSNNLQRKQTTIPSNQVGLANIQTKYRMLQIENMTVRQTGEQFIVRLPLIQPDTINIPTHEYTYH